MTPSPLLGGIPATAATGGGSSTGRGNTTGDGGRFERLMQQPERTGTPRSKAASSAHAAPQPSHADGQARRADASTRHADGGDHDRDADAATPVDDDRDPAPQATADTPLWPPQGLAGLALSMPQALVDSPGVPADAGEPATLPTPSSTAATAALPAALATTAGDPTAAAATVPADASDEVSFDELAAVLATVSPEQADASQADAPLPAPLHGIGALQTLRGGVDVAGVGTPPPTPVPVLGQEGFDDALSARIGWLADQKIGHAHIRISPDDLGAIDVRLQMDGDRVHASFSSPHVDVRHALESSLPRLRELLGEQGFQLAHADVGQHAQGGASSSGNGHGSGNGGGLDSDPAPGEVTVSAAQLIRQRGILDAYA